MDGTDKDLVRGGQGRSGLDVKCYALALAWTALFIASLIVLAVIEVVTR